MYLVTQETEANNAVHNFELIFRDVLNKHAPLKEKLFTRKHQPRWFNGEIRNAMNIRNKAKVRNNCQMYRFWQNKVTSLIRSAKSNYFKQEITFKTSNAKAMWQVIRNVQANNSGMQNINIPNLVIKDDNKISEPDGVLNAFN